ncbi:hypothetical protein LPJ73_000579 [Coemansia sp. RSA 2703]|nr:hypothetical protein LPJ73_000579 [Coemansia sp. RSA 2703]
MYIDEHLTHLASLSGMTSWCVGGLRGAWAVAEPTMPLADTIHEADSPKTVSMGNAMVCNETTVTTLAPEVRLAGAVGKPEVELPVREPQEGKVRSMEASEQVAPAIKHIEERLAVRDVCMNHLERRLDDICMLLANLMIDRGSGGYYEGKEGTPLPMTGRMRFEYQEPPLFSTPSGAMREQVSSAEVARAAPGRACGVSPANKQPTLI